MTYQNDQVQYNVIEDINRIIAEAEKSDIETRNCFFTYGGKNTKPSEGNRG